MTEKYILFDFDGTIADSSEGVFACVIHAMKTLGLPVASVSELRKFIGPPLRESFQTRCGLSEEESERAVAIYRELYTEKGVLMCRAYDGIGDLLDSLTEKGFTLAVATSKPEVYARQILDNLKLSHRFTFIAGAEFAGKRTDKPSVIGYALTSLGIAPEQALMVGDRFHDVEGAHAFGMRCAGVLWGFGSREEFKECGADFVCADMQELEELISALPERN